MKEQDLQSKKNIVKNKLKINKIEKIDICIFCTILIIFTIALLSFFPAILTSDSVDQMKQIETRKLWYITSNTSYIYFGKYSKNIWRGSGICYVPNNSICNNLDMGL